MDLSSIARWVILAGVAIIIVGIGLWLAGRFDLPIGRLPGDIHIERGGFS